MKVGEHVDIRTIAKQVIIEKGALPKQQILFGQESILLM